jgi:hypothetical protein
MSVRADVAASSKSGGGCDKGRERLQHCTAVWCVRPVSNPHPPFLRPNTPPSGLSLGPPKRPPARVAAHLGLLAPLGRRAHRLGLGQQRAHRRPQQPAQAAPSATTPAPGATGRRGLAAGVSGGQRREGRGRTLDRVVARVGRALGGACSSAYGAEAGGAA